ncbi:MAG: glycosyltransferase family 39 protein [Candidatus Rokubacteria bacterium]|nr:glycosyltransferase family 39 protein [Candidatus Rokubacteria bacterium]
MAAVVMLGVDLGGRVFVGNDEARFAVLAQDVLAHGHWWFPRVNVETVYQNKPLLLAWLIALVSWPAGHVTQLTAVVPSALAALATALVVGALAGAALGATAGLVAALVTLTSHGLVFHARVPLPDMLMTAGMTASVWMLWRLRVGRPHAWIGFYGFAVAAFWAKGTAGLLPLVVAVAWWIVDRPEGGWSMLRLPAGALGVLALIAPWWVVTLTGPRTSVGGGVMVDQVLWYLPRLTSVDTLVEPLKNLSGVLFPWALLVPLVLAHAARTLRARDAEGEALRFIGVWAAVLFVLVALSRQQRYRYYLPLVPPLALLIGWWWAALFEGAPVRRVPWKTYGAIVAVLFVSAIGSLVAPASWPRSLRVTGSAPLAEIALAVMGLAAVGWALALVARSGRMRAVFAVACAAAGAGLLVANHAETVRRNHAWDYPGLARRLGPALPAGALVVAPESQDLAVGFYLDRPTIAVVDPRLGQAIAGRSALAAILTDEERERYGASLPGEPYATESLGRGRVTVTIHPRPAGG